MTPEKEYLDQLKRNSSAYYSHPSAESRSGGNPFGSFSSGLGGAATGAAASTLGGAAGLPRWLTGLAPQGASMAGQMMGLPSMITSPLAAIAKAALHENVAPTGNDHYAGDTIGNAFLKAGASALIPGIGLPLSVMSMFGFNPMQGIRDWADDDFASKEGSGYHGGFWGDGSWDKDTSTYKYGYGNPASSYYNERPLDDGYASDWSDYTDATQQYGYSNPASSYASQSTPNNYTAATQQYGYSNPAASYAGQTSDSED